MCVGNVERDGILWVTVVKKGKGVLLAEETEIGLGRRAGWACSSLACCLAILSPADATESRLKYPPVVECSPGVWEAQESVPPTKVGDLS